MKNWQLDSIFMKIILMGMVLVNCSLVWADAAVSQESSETQPERDEFLSRSQKVLLLNVGALAAVTLYGISIWDYGSEGFHVKNEGWFGRNTPHGGADKLSHFWTGYAGSHLFSYIYRSWGYSDHEANAYGALNMLGVNVFIEIADGFSDHGFSHEDLIMNILGAGAGYIWGRYPRLAEKIDFRMEYTPQFDSDDLTFNTNYESQKFLVAIKAEGFDAIKNPYLKYAELHCGYYARGFDDFSPRGPDDRRRTVFVGVGFNVSRLIQKFVNTTVFNYIQIPYTSLQFDIHID